MAKTVPIATRVQTAVKNWQAGLIEARLAEAKKGGPTVSHERVQAWMKSWGRRRELPRPKPRPALARSIPPC